MKYEFHVGDYVETKSGIKGYISDTDVRPNYFSWIVTESKGVKEAASPGSLTYSTDLTQYKRIGKYTSFDETSDDSSVKEISRLGHDEQKGDFKLYQMINAEAYGVKENIVNLNEMQRKINELVDAVNELRKAK